MPELREEVKSINVEFNNQPFSGVTLSLGVAVFPEHGTTIEEVLRVADSALYQAKHEGRNRVVVWRNVESKTGFSHG